MKLCTYLMPIRRAVFNRSEAELLRSYLQSITHAVSEIIVVDGSPDEVFAAHNRIWREVCRHESVDRQFGYLNDKVNGIQTGVRLANCDKIILADDDIRYSYDNITEIVSRLGQFDVVRPQNYFRFKVGRSAESPSGAADALESLPVFAKTEAARMLINRATLRIADYPGTCAFHREVFLRAGGYDGDVLFDNEELIRHLAQTRARICYANDLFVQKRPPTFRKWLEQRPRQAYEDFGLRIKTILFALLPIILIAALVFAGLKAMILTLLGITLAAVGLAVVGWSRGAARKFFPFQICLYAPVWVFERSVSTYWAFYWFFRYGGYPFGGQLLKKGIGRDWIEGGRIASQAIAKLQPHK
jgi:glycosyl transferase family 21